MSLLVLLQASPYLSAAGRGCLPDAWFAIWHHAMKCQCIIATCVAPGAELGRDWALVQPERLEGRQLAAAEVAYSVAAAVADIRSAHDALSARLTSLALRMAEHSVQRSILPPEVRAWLSMAAFLPQWLFWTS